MMGVLVKVELGEKEELILVETSVEPVEAGSVEMEETQRQCKAEVEVVYMIMRPVQLQVQEGGKAFFGLMAVKMHRLILALVVAPALTEINLKKEEQDY